MYTRTHTHTHTHVYSHGWTKKGLRYLILSYEALSKEINNLKNGTYVRTDVQTTQRLIRPAMTVADADA